MLHQVEFCIIWSKGGILTYSSLSNNEVEFENAAFS